jgi:hypothetical protein
MPAGQDLRALVRELGRGIMEGQLHNLRHYTELRELMATGAIDDRTVADAYRSYVREVSGDYNRRLTDLSVRYYADLLELSNEFSRQFYERILGRIGDGRAAGEPPPPMPMELSGWLGGQAEGRFELTNDTPDTVDISFLASPLRGPDGTVFRPIVVFEPARFRLQAAEAQSVSIRVMLEPAMFEPNRIYTGMVEVLGFPDVSLALSVWASSAPASSGETADGPAHAEEQDMTGEVGQEDVAEEAAKPHAAGTQDAGAARSGKPRSGTAQKKTTRPRTTRSRTTRDPH